MGIKITANFNELGLNDADKKADFSRDFEKTMEEKLGGNKVIVTSVEAGTDFFLFFFFLYGLLVKKIRPCYVMMMTTNSEVSQK